MHKDKETTRLKWWQYCGLIILVFCLFYLAYFAQRSNFLLLFGSFTLAFLGYYLIVRRVVNFSVRNIIVLGMAFRIIFLFATPELSDDFYRFVWDGRLLKHGINPYELTPAQLSKEDKALVDPNGILFSNLNSQDYYTVYPPFSQMLYVAAGTLGGDNLGNSVIILRILLMLFELGVMILLIRLLRLWQKDERRVSWYAWNPLVIVEISGNLHFEGVMLFFIFAGLYLWRKMKGSTAAAAIGLAISTKLLPIILLPFTIREVGWKKGIIFAAGALSISVLTFLPFLTGDFVKNFGSSIDLYFRSFEFNASLYYLVKEVCLVLFEYSENFRLIGLVLSIIAGLLILFVALSKKIYPGELFVRLLLALTIYYFFTTTIHPWYIITLVGVNCLAGMLYPQYWSFLVLISYYHYNGGGFHENYWVIALEYVLLLIGIFHCQRERQKVLQQI